MFNPFKRLKELEKVCAALVASLNQLASCSKCGSVFLMGNDPLKPQHGSIAKDKLYLYCSACTPKRKPKGKSNAK